MHTWAARGLAIAVAVLAGAGGLALAGPGVALASTSTVTNCDGSGPGSLLDAVTNAAAHDTIAFDPTLSCDQITLAASLFINKDLTITGPGAAAMTVGIGPVAPVVDIIANVQDKGRDRYFWEKISNVKVAHRVVLHLVERLSLPCCCFRKMSDPRSSSRVSSKLRWPCSDRDPLVLSND